MTESTNTHSLNPAPSSETKVKTRNKGELSELLVLLRLLHNPRLPVVDGDMHLTGDNIDVHSIKRCEKRIDNTPIWIEYVHDHVQNQIIIREGQLGNFAILGSASPKEAKRLHDQLLELIISPKVKKVPCDHPVLMDAYALLHTKEVAAKSVDKSDFIATISTANNPMNSTRGFSIKSQAGSNSTLINSSKMNSAFKFRVTREGRGLVKAERDVLLAWPEKNKDRYKRLIAEGYRLDFVKCQGEYCQYNLMMMDGLAPNILGALLFERHFFDKQSSTLNVLTERLCSPENLDNYPFLHQLGTTDESRYKSVAFKVKKILLAFSASATVGSPWDGDNQNSGGIVVVTKNGDVTCLDTFTQDGLAAYLYTRTFFETPSLNRHGGEEFYEEDDDLFIDLQLQVRFS